MIIAATGHRPDKLGGYGMMDAMRLTMFAAKHLVLLREDRGLSKVISGMAQGWDMAVASAAGLVGIPWIAAVPFKGQEKKWPADVQEQYNILLGAATEVVIISEGDYAVWKMIVRNQWMVDHCDEVLALWNGTSGGTGSCIAYANKIEKPVMNVWDEWEIIK